MPPWKFWYLNATRQVKIHSQRRKQTYKLPMRVFATPNKYDGTGCPLVIFMQFKSCSKYLMRNIIGIKNSAMENWSFIVFMMLNNGNNATFVHEISQHWFGNLVTWFDGKIVSTCMHLRIPWTALAMEEGDLFVALDHAAKEDGTLGVSLSVMEMLFAWSRQASFPLRNYANGSITISLERYVHGRFSNLIIATIWWIPYIFATAKSPSSGSLLSRHIRHKKLEINCRWIEFIRREYYSSD